MGFRGVQAAKRATVRANSALSLTALSSRNVKSAGCSAFREGKHRLVRVRRKKALAKVLPIPCTNAVVAHT